MICKNGKLKIRLKLSAKFQIFEKIRIFIFTDGALVLPEGTLGMMEASTTRKLCTP
jgi:hypothetical protein